MEGGSKAKVFRQGKTIRYWGDLPEDFKSHIPRAEFLAGEPEAEVSSREPNPLAGLVLWVGSAVSVGLSLAAIYGPLEVCARFHVSSLRLNQSSTEGMLVGSPDHRSSGG